MRTRSRLVATLLTGLLLASCASADDGAATGPADEVEDTTGEDHDAMDPDDHAAMEEAGTAEEAGAADEEVDAATDIGEDADPSEATRTIEVEAFDMAFDPERIEVEAGEVVTFRVTNTGEAVHEFFIGDAAMQQEHADEMAEMGHDMAHDEPNSISLDPGETGELTWRFGDSGRVEFACHEPGHYDAGMLGSFVVS